VWKPLSIKKVTVPKYNAYCKPKLEGHRDYGILGREETVGLIWGGKEVIEVECQEWCERIFMLIQVDWVV
jgi:hypothetical protein